MRPFEASNLNLQILRRLLALLGLVPLAAIACTRSLPPDVSEFKPPAARKPAPVASAPAPKEPPQPIAAAPPIHTELPPPQASQPQVAAPPPPAVKPAAPAAKAPSIVGAWQIVEMSHNGQAMPMPPGATMTLTFAEGGTVSMTMGGGPEGGQSRQGTYSVTGNSITIAMDSDTKTGTLSFEGNDRAIIEVEEMRMTLSRTPG